MQRKIRVRSRWGCWAGYAGFSGYSGLSGQSGKALRSQRGPWVVRWCGSAVVGGIFRTFLVGITVATGPFCVRQATRDLQSDIPSARHTRVARRLSHVPSSPPPSNLGAPAPFRPAGALGRRNRHLSPFPVSQFQLLSLSAFQLPRWRRQPPRFSAGCSHRRHSPSTWMVFPSTCSSRA